MTDNTPAWLAQRIIYLVGEVNDQSASNLIFQMLECNRVDSKKPIDLFINSPGGGVHSGLGLYDVMQSISAPVRTLCLGWAMSMGSLLLTAGAKGDRYALPKASIMTHSIQYGMQGAFGDLKVEYEYAKDIQKKLRKIYVNHTGQSKKAVDKLLARNTYMSAEEAKKNGLIDHILEYPTNLPLGTGIQAQGATA